MGLFWVALLLGVVEGLTEFLPVSSTGHLIVVSELVGFHGPRAEIFQIFIQLGAILAVAWEYRIKLFGMVAQTWTSREARGFVLRLGLAFLPSALLGLAFFGWITDHLFSPRTVATALIAGGVLILVVEGLHLEPRTFTVESVSWKQALGIGAAQCLSLWPGFSRSAATILGGLCCGLNRPAATEFSFLLAIPTMFGATLYALFAERKALEPGDTIWLALSFVVSFFVGWGAVRWLLGFVARHSFRPFAWYRLAVGVLILLLFVE